MDFTETANYWLTEAEEALLVARHLVEKGDYSYALFFGHLAIEKLLKARYVKRHGEHAPPIHNLLRLARLAGLEMNTEQQDVLVRISAFNIEARYPDMKRAFREKCTQDFTTKQLNEINEIYQWIHAWLT